MAGLGQLVAFQIENRITGILAVGTTGESPTLTWDEHVGVINAVASQCKDHCICIAGTGSNNTAETLTATAHAAKSGVDGVLLVDPYYNGPSSLEIRKEYIAPVAEAFPEIHVIPYVIPGRTGAQLFPEDLALLKDQYANVNCVKEATGDLANMIRTRKCCGPDYIILSGDDGMTPAMMIRADIKSNGVISVVSNIAPKAVADMVRAFLNGRTAEGEKLAADLQPLFDIVTIKTAEGTSYGDVTCRARNPLPIKTLMRILGLPSGPCRQPLGKMTRHGIQAVITAARQVLDTAPYIFEPAAAFFGIDIEARLNDSTSLEGLYYLEY